MKEFFSFFFRKYESRASVTSVGAQHNGCASTTIDGGSARGARRRVPCRREGPDTRPVAPSRLPPRPSTVRRGASHVAREVRREERHVGLGLVGAGRRSC